MVNAPKLTFSKTPFLICSKGVFSCFENATRNSFLNVYNLFCKAGKTLEPLSYFFFRAGRTGKDSGIKAGLWVSPDAVYISLPGTDSPNIFAKRGNAYDGTQGRTYLWNRIFQYMEK